MRTGGTRKKRVRWNRITLEIMNMKSGWTGPDSPNPRVPDLMKAIEVWKVLF